MSYYFGSLVSNASREFHRGQAGLHRRGKVVQIGLRVRNHAEIGDFYPPEAVLARELHAALEMVMRAPHAATGIFSIAQSTQRPCLELQRPGPLRIGEGRPMFAKT